MKFIVRRAAILWLLGAGSLLAGCASLGDIAKGKCEGDAAADYSDCVSSKFDREQHDLEDMINWRQNVDQYHGP
ncbi:MAG TPA: hypothetical protein VM755_20590 [Stellaceae bacterium]|nr:hypothetical protein [Stellaceae bacterium]